MRWWEVLGWIGAFALLISRWHLNLLRSRLLSLVGSVGLLICAVMLRAWPLAAGFVILLGIGVAKLWHLQMRRADRGFQVLEVSPQDEYLRYVLRIHGQDILAHQPGFFWDGAAEGRSAAILQHGPETIGVVLIRTEPGDKNADVAHLELDYVTPRYRNIAPGRFIFMQSGFFQARGFRRVLTPPGMEATNYYERLGFTPVADHYQLDLPP